MRSPGIIVVGEVVRVRNRLRWFEEGMFVRETAATQTQRREAVLSKLIQPESA
jgi:hypothetical protein